MTVKDAVVKRFEQLCDQRGIRPNELANLSGVTPSTVYLTLLASGFPLLLLRSYVTVLISHLANFSPARFLMT